MGGIAEAGRSSRVCPSEEVSNHMEKHGVAWRRQRYELLLSGGSHVCRLEVRDRATKGDGNRDNWG